MKKMKIILLTLIIDINHQKNFYSKIIGFFLFIFLLIHKEKLT